ncbi:SGNH/GDSL hydrolase family protein [Serratia ficaria]|uniref:SGNH/GDSL hydrolase family protein n=3 Tax=Serratia ficaria TaxID=61651 RepID=UPI00217918FF|nr:SGNH/GDSL hydrolase family protein [Serratia ficaria]CAI1143033.1 Uncharacterised protein [Serratia ficaria]CAI1950706.1 Uncharacterised protein [Serratia ficaria]CAI2787787.1 Uncharacterised protein [Serratia ficaria]
MADKKVKLTSLPTLNTIGNDSDLLINQAGNDFKVSANKFVQTSNNLSDVDPEIARNNIGAISRDEANELSEVKTYYITPGDPDGTIAGLAGTPDGNYFRVGQGAGGGFKYYLNDNGAAVEISELPGSAEVNSAIDTATSVDNRTSGIYTTDEQDGRTIFADIHGRMAMEIKGSGDKTLYGKTQAYDLSVDESLTLSDSIMLPSADSAYDFGLIGNNQRVAFGLRKGGKVLEYHGVPMTTQRGALPSDVFSIGDSITAFGQAASGSNATGTIYKPLVNAQCWAAWAMLKTGARYRYVGMSATGGFTASQILATHVPKAIVAKPTFCIVLAGRNDVVKLLDFETETRPALAQIYLQLRFAGIIPIVCTMSAQSGNSEAQDVLRYKINAFCRQYAAKYGLPLVDLHAATTDPLTGQWIPGYNQDASHPWPIAAKVMGEAVADAMIEWQAPTTPRKAVSVTTPTNSDNILPNPLFIESSDGVPSGWVVDSSGVFSVETDPDILGNAFVMTGAGTSIAAAHCTVPVDAGQKYGFGVEIKMSANSSSWVSIYVVSGTSIIGGAETIYLAGIRNWKYSTDGYGYFYYEFTAPSDYSEVTIIAKAQDGTLRVAQGGLFTIADTTGV